MTGLHPDTISLVTDATRPKPGRGRPPALPHETRVLLVLCALRTNLTERALAAVFGTSQATVHRTIRALLPKVSALFEASLGNETLLVDGTLIPVHDQSVTACSKNYRRSVNTQIIATVTRRVALVGSAWPGNRNDIIVARHTLPDLTGHSVLADGAYRSLPGVTVPPPRTDPDARAAHRKIRARVEHVIARLKDWQILRQCRRRGHSINQALRAVAYLYNLNAELRINS